MNKVKQKQRDRQQHPAKPRGRRKFFILTAVVLMLGSLPLLRSYEEPTVVLMR